MITFSQLGKHGRLGNQLFQYAALKGLSVKNGYDIGMMSDMSEAMGTDKNAYFPILT